MAPLLELDADQMRERLYTRRDDLPSGQSPLPIKLLHINKCPVLAPAKTLLPENAERLDIDRARCLQNLQTLRQNTQIREKVVALYAEAEPFTPSQNVDARLYDGFFGDADRSTMRIIQQTAPENLPALDLRFQDSRLEELLFRFRARNYPATLNDDEQRRWLAHRREALNAEKVQDYVLQLEAIYNLHEDDAEKTALLKALFDYGKKLVG